MRNATQLLGCPQDPKILSSHCSCSIAAAVCNRSSCSWQCLQGLVQSSCRGVHPPLKTASLAFMFKYCLVDLFPSLFLSLERKKVVHVHTAMFCPSSLGDTHLAYVPLWIPDLLSLLHVCLEAGTLLCSPHLALQYLGKLTAKTMLAALLALFRASSNLVMLLW